MWHGFTQMSCYTESNPVLVAAGDGHELIDVDGRRYLDAISSLWVNTLGSWLSDRFGLRLVPNAAALAELVRAGPTTGPTAS